MTPIVGNIYHPHTIAASVASQGTVRPDVAEPMPPRGVPLSAAETAGHRVHRRPRPVARPLSSGRFGEATRTVRAAVSTLSAPLALGPVRSATVVARTRLGCYLLLDDGAEVLPLLTSDALALPTAARLNESSGTDPLGAGLSLGGRVAVGLSRVAARGLVVEIVRTARPARVRVVTGDLPHTPLGPTRVRELLGRGPGLTPEGDDELAGHLLVTAAAGEAPDLEAHLHRTTALSASLLRAASQGYAVPAVVAYLDAVLGGDVLTARRQRPLVAAIGHTSGPALLRGIDAALARPAEPSSERTVG
jgi:hypothetical protein